MQVAGPFAMANPRHQGVGGMHSDVTGGHRDGGQRWRHVGRLGQIVEAGPVSKVLHDPDTAYTRSLLEAIPGQDYERSLAAADEG